MLQWEHSAILSTFIKLPFDIKIFVLSIFEWPLKTGFTVLVIYITGSPFQCLVDNVDGGYISVFGPGLVGGLSGQTETFTVVAKSGNLSKICSFILTPGRRQSKTSILSTNVD